MAALGVRNFVSEFHKISIFNTNKSFAGNILKEKLKIIKSKHFVRLPALFVNRVPALYNSIKSNPSPTSSAFGNFLRPASAGFLSCRGFSSDPGDPLGKVKKDKEDGDDKKPLRLMDFNELIWPNPLKTLRNYFFSWLIRGYFDEQFSRETFLTGTEQVLVYYLQAKRQKLNVPLDEDLSKGLAHSEWYSSSCINDCPYLSAGSDCIIILLCDHMSSINVGCI